MKQKNEKERFIRETVIKYFFDMSKSTYTIMVLGGLAALFKIIKTDQDGTVSAIYLGIVLTIVLAIIGLIISKRQNYECFRINFCYLLSASIGFFSMALYPMG